MFNGGTIHFWGLTMAAAALRCAISQVFDQGLDLISAIQWWRKRVPRNPPGTARAAARAIAFAVFEGSFNAEAGDESSKR
eukprot:Skav206471  [mRNA]  locus=scaffold1672:137653:138433:+ [translate_table: standard]